METKKAITDRYPPVRPISFVMGRGQRRKIDIVEIESHCSKEKNRLPEEGKTARGKKKRNADAQEPQREPGGLKGNGSVRKTKGI